MDIFSPSKIRVSSLAWLFSSRYSIPSRLGITVLFTKCHSCLLSLIKLNLFLHNRPKHNHPTTFLIHTPSSLYLHYSGLHAQRFQIWNICHWTAKWFSGVNWRPAQVLVGNLIWFVISILKPVLRRFRSMHFQNEEQVPPRDSLRHQWSSFGSRWMHVVPIPS